MGELNLKIKHKLLLLILFLVILVSIAIMGSTLYFSSDGKNQILKGVTANLEKLQETSITEFHKFTQLANEGIRKSSGLAAVDEIILLALDNQERLAGVIGAAIESIMGDVTRTIMSQDRIISKGFDDLLDNSKTSLDEIIKANKTSQTVLADVATYNMTSLNASISDSLGRFTVMLNTLEKNLRTMVATNNEEIDGILIEFINLQENSRQGPEEKLAYIMEALNTFKANSENRKSALFKRVQTAFSEQRAVMDQELKLVNRNIRFAIQDEFVNAGATQIEKDAQIIKRLLANQATVKGKVAQANNSLKLAVARVKTNMPVELKKKGDEASRKIRKQTAVASKSAESVYSMVVTRTNNNMRAVVTKFEEGIKDSQNFIEKTITKSAYKTAGYSLIIAALGAFVALGLGFFIIKSVADPLTRVVALTNKVSEGDFTQTPVIKQKDEIGQFLTAIKNMVERLRELIQSVSNVTEKVNSSALEISTTVQEQSSIVAEQSSAISEIGATIKEFSQSSSQIAKNAEAVVDIAASNLMEAEKGFEAVKAVVSQMDEISKENQRSINEIIGLSHKSRAISKFMEIINNIADQTKLIAFNAALEASSAGESGKRFGVVAAEIRRLADSVMESTGEIEIKIDEIQEAFNHLVIASEKGSKKVQTGMAASARTTEILGNLLTEAKLTEDSAKQISLSTQQQKTASEQVVTALREIDTGAKQSTISINQVNEISMNLAELSGDLKDLVGKFKLGE